MAHPPDWDNLPWAEKVQLANTFLRGIRAKWLQATWSVDAENPDTAWEAADAAREEGKESDADDLEAIAIALEEELLKRQRRAHVQQANEQRQLTFPWGAP